MRVSIIIPTYNQKEEYLKACLLSAFSQDIPCEIVLVDDGSDDPRSVRRLVEKLSIPSRHEFKLHLKPNGGVASALNAGIFISRGDYVCWLPSDDLFTKDKCRIQSFEMEQEDYYVSYTAYEEGIPQGATWPARQYPSREELHEALKRRCFINAATVMWKKEAFRIIGTFNEEIIHAQDYEFLLRSSLHCNFWAINLPMTRRRVHEGQMLRTLSDPKEAEKKYKDMEYIKKTYGAVGGVWLPGERL